MFMCISKYLIYYIFYKETIYIYIYYLVYPMYDAYIYPKMCFFQPLRLDFGSEHHRSGTTSKQTFTRQTHPQAGQFFERPLGSLRWMDFVLFWLFWRVFFEGKISNQLKKERKRKGLRSSGSSIKSIRFGRLLGKMLQ